MRTRFLIVLVAALMASAFVTMAWADEAAAPAKEEKAMHEYVGVAKCKICHKKDGIFESWEATTHATAYGKLSDADKANKDLMPFYTTGTDAKGELLTGIQCEACHGPGADYKKKSVMEDREAAVAAGLIIPDEKTCMKCHNEKAPGALGASAKDWDFAKMKAKGVHVMKAEAAESE